VEVCSRKLRLPARFLGLLVEEPGDFLPAKGNKMILSAKMEVKPLSRP